MDVAFDGERTLTVSVAGLLDDVGVGLLVNVMKEYTKLPSTLHNINTSIQSSVTSSLSGCHLTNLVCGYVSSSTSISPRCLEQVLTGHLQLSMTQADTAVPQTPICSRF